MLEDAIRSSEFVLGVASPEQLPDSSLPEIAFVGRSNVGKSSLINMLLGRVNLARTSAAPGKTRQFNFYLVNGGVHLVDLPGLGYAKVSRQERNRWAREIESYLSGRQALRLVFHLVDGRHGLLAADDRLVEIYRDLDLPVVVVLTKADKLSGNERAAAVRGVATHLSGMALELPVVVSSARTRRGREELLEWFRLVAG